MLEKGRYKLELDGCYNLGEGSDTGDRLFLMMKLIIRVNTYIGISKVGIIG